MIVLFFLIYVFSTLIFMPQCKKIKSLMFLKVLVLGIYLSKYVLSKQLYFFLFVNVVMSVIFRSHSRPSVRITRLNFHLIS